MRTADIRQNSVKMECRFFVYLGRMYHLSEAEEVLGDGDWVLFPDGTAEEVTDNKPKKIKLCEH